VPIVLKDRDTNRIEIQLKVEKITFDKLEINENISKKIFERTGEVDRIEVSLLIPKK
jgi:hypothetical protein